MLSRRTILQLAGAAALPLSSGLLGGPAQAAAAARIFSPRQHAYTRQLLSAIPLPDVEPGWLEDAGQFVISHQQGSVV